MSSDENHMSMFIYMKLVLEAAKNMGPTKLTPATCENLKGVAMMAARAYFPTDGASRLTGETHSQQSDR